MRRLSLGTVSLVFATVVIALYALHYGNVVRILNTVIAPMIALFGTLLGIMGFFERDKRRIPALLGMGVNLGLLATWIVLLVQSMAG